MHEWTRLLSGWLVDEAVGRSFIELIALIFCISYRCFEYNEGGRCESLLEMSWLYVRSYDFLCFPSHVAFIFIYVFRIFLLGYHFSIILFFNDYSHYYISIIITTIFFLFF